jgi:hypothetical protein
MIREENCFAEEWDGSGLGGAKIEKYLELQELQGTAQFSKLAVEPRQLAAARAKN